MRDRTMYALVGGVMGSLIGYGLRRWLMVPVFVESFLTLGGGLSMIAWAERSKRAEKSDPPEDGGPNALSDRARSV